MTIYPLRTILAQILAIIDFKDNKNEFVDDFVLVACQKAVVALGEELSPEKQLSFHQELEEADSIVQTQLLLSGYFDQAQIDSVFATEVRRLLAEYVATILPGIPIEKQEELKELLGSFENASILID